MHAQSLGLFSADTSSAGVKPDLSRGSDRLENTSGSLLNDVPPAESGPDDCSEVQQKVRNRLCGHKCGKVSVSVREGEQQDKAVNPASRLVSYCFMTVSF